MAYIAIATAITARAELFTTIVDFGAPNRPGGTPAGNLLPGSDGMIYGATAGTIFKVKADGSGFTTLKSFNGSSDGQGPAAGVILSGVLYGTTTGGGINGFGTVFKINTSGTGFQVLKSFAAAECKYPTGSLVLDRDILYGTTTSGGGGFGSGAVFRVKTTGLAFSVIYVFSDFATHSPNSGFVQSGNTIFGTAYSVSNDGFGSVFAVNTEVSGCTILHYFNGHDGMNLIGGLVRDGNALYGVSSAAIDGGGTVFKVNTDGSAFEVLKTLNGNDGGYLTSGLTLTNGTLYGTAAIGGSFNCGTVFQIRTNGEEFKVLKHFTGPDGASPESVLTVIGDTLFGTTWGGGAYGKGTMFKLKLVGNPPLLQIARKSTNSGILTWTNAAFTLQSAATAAGVYTNVPGATSPYTNNVTGRQNFYRLVAN